MGVRKSGEVPYLILGSLKLQGGPLIPLNVWEVPGFFFFISDNKEIQHGSPGVLGFI